MSTDRTSARPSLPLVAALLAWAALVYAAYLASYLG
jgi:hypothetical protein